MTHSNQNSNNDAKIDPLSGRLRADESATIRRILAAHPEIKCGILFGSRARGTARPGSDVDIALVGATTLDTLATVKRELEEGTNIPYFFDIVAYDTIVNADLKKEIDECGVVFFERVDTTP